jgi:KUP system potassium uptake protein
MTGTSGTGITPASTSSREAAHPTTNALALAALGVVFGDIGTSPLYALKAAMSATGGTPGRLEALGSLSLIVWVLIFVVSIKYVMVAMRVDNHGEGGIMALMSLLGGRKAKRHVIIAVGLFGAALIYGDGAITPAISVLSALEGLEIITPAFQPYILPLTIAVLVGLFVIQPGGTARIGRLFGPVTAVWFLCLGILGLRGILHEPSVLYAIDPRYAFAYLYSGGAGAFLVLGAVFLCVTGAEALYADMGHFGRKPIVLGWWGIVLPCLLLNYAGQTALVLSGTPPTENLFYALCPPVFMVPYVILATAATIIASQAIITGAFSMTRQAIQLGWLPRLHITQTSAEGFGQIYVGAVNWLLMIVTISLTIGFQKSENLAAAYGIAVSLTMLMTSVLLFIALREHLRWSLTASLAVSGCFVALDSTFVIANMAKIGEGGYVPILLALGVYAVMWLWHKGREALGEALSAKPIPIGEFLAGLAAKGVPRVSGAAVFLTRSKNGVPEVMAWHVRHNRALHEQLFVLNVLTEPVPWVSAQDRLVFEEQAPLFWRATARYGFMERPDIPRLLTQAKEAGCQIGLDDVTYYVGHDSVVPREDGKGLPRWAVRLFAIMERNSTHVTDYFKLPANSVVEIGRQVGI